MWWGRSGRPSRLFCSSLVLAWLLRVSGVSLPSTLQERFRVPSDGKLELGRRYSSVALKVLDSENNNQVVVLKVFLKKFRDKSPDPVFVSGDDPEFITKWKAVFSRECDSSKSFEARKEEDPDGYSRIGLCLEKHLDGYPAYLLTTYDGSTSAYDWIKNDRPSLVGDWGGHKAAREIFKQLQEGVEYMEGCNPPVDHGDLHLGNFVLDATPEAGISTRIIDWESMNQAAHWLPDNFQIRVNFAMLLCPSKSFKPGEDIDSAYITWWRSKISHATTVDEILSIFSATDSVINGVQVAACAVCNEDHICPGNVISRFDALHILAHVLPVQEKAATTKKPGISIFIGAILLLLLLCLAAWFFMDKRKHSRNPFLGTELSLTPKQTLC